MHFKRTFRILSPIFLSLLIAIQAFVDIGIAGLLVTMLVCFLAYFRSALLVYVMLFSAFALNQYITYFSRSLFYYIIVIYIIAFIVKRLVMSRPISLTINDIILSFILFYFFAITLVFNSYDSIYYMALYFVLIIVIRLELGIPSSENMKEGGFVLSINLAFITAGLVALAKGNFALSAGYGSVVRFLGSFGDPNFFALFGLVGIAYFLENDFSLSSRIIRYLLLSLTLVLVVITYSKTGFVILLTIFAARLLRKRKHTLLALVAFSILSLLLFCFLLLIYFDTIEIAFLSNYFDRFFTEYSGLNVFDSLSTGRWNIQSTLFSEFLNTQIVNQLFGAGYDSSRKLMYDYSDRLISAHSVYLQMLVDFGWLGLTFYCFLLISLLLKHRYSGLVFAIASFSLSWPFTLPFLALFVLTPAEVTRRRLAFRSSSYPNEIASARI